MLAAYEDRGRFESLELVAPTWASALAPLAAHRTWRARGGRGRRVDFLPDFHLYGDDGGSSARPPRNDCRTQLISRPAAND